MASFPRPSAAEISNEANRDYSHSSLAYKTRVMRTDFGFWLADNYPEYFYTFLHYQDSTVTLALTRSREYSTDRVEISIKVVQDAETMLNELIVRTRLALS